jgi:hypothetical protein
VTILPIPESKLLSVEVQGSFFLRVFKEITGSPRLITEKL